MKYALAIDIGASSGRHIVGWYENGEIRSREVYRFPNGMKETDGRLTWDIGQLMREVQNGIDEAVRQFGKIDTLSVDTWAVDYVLLRGSEEVLPCYAYRDSRGAEAAKRVHDIIAFSELYAVTGIQYQPFNSIYQLKDDLDSGRLAGVTDFLMMPEYILWKLCGIKAKEYTNATSTGLVNAQTGEFDLSIADRLSLPRHLFPSLQKPGSSLGLTREGIRCVLCATHDTASAVEGIPMPGDALYLSSGTWSLLGARIISPITTQESLEGNFTNEGGVGYIRYLKNIMGMWLINSLRDELCPGTPFAEIVAMAERSAGTVTINANDPSLMAPKSMKAAFDALLPAPFTETGDYFRCAYLSLARCYADAISEIERNTNRVYSAMYIVGGGAKNEFLNSLTRVASGKNVIALPIEATALGNLKLQLTRG